MQDFASLVRTARTQRGWTQAQLAEAAGMTPSYISFLENRKKPPPSDQAVESLAHALKTPAGPLLEQAHLERAPEPLQRKVKALSQSLRREVRSRFVLLESLLPPLLSGPPALLDATLASIRISEARRRRLREVLRILGRERIEEASRLSRMLDRLPARDRRALMDALPALAGSTLRLPHRAKSALRYAPPAAGEAKVAYELRAEQEVAAAHVQAGDLLQVDPSLAARDGDWVVLRGAEEPCLRRVLDTGAGWRLCAAPGGEETPLMDARSLASYLEKLGAGVITEIRRPMRPQASGDGSGAARGAPSRD
ncbi:MAG: helix-turn-helix domain-containing protein [Planctomycetaceae bacterium]